MNIDEIKQVLQNVFDSVSESHDGNYIARIKLTDGMSTQTAKGIMRNKLCSHIPQAEILLSGNVVSKGRVVQWWIEFAVL